MKGNGKKLSLPAYDEIFSTEESRADAAREKVMDIPLSELHPFANHPFRVVDDEKMQETVDSIAENGILVPAIARPRPDGGYELISGHRRKHGCELLGLETTSSKDIANEGDKLHHCVGRYIPSVVKEKCIILFIRKASAPRSMNRWFMAFRRIMR